MDTKWSLPVTIGLPILGIVAVIFLLCIVALFLAGEYGIGVGSFGVLIVIATIAGLAYWPWKAEYHQWRPVSGIVQQTNKRLVSDGNNGMSEKIVVVINDQEYGCNDTRCTLAAQGDTLSLRCKRTWEYGSTDGYDCRFVSRKVR